MGNADKAKGKEKARVRKGNTREGGKCALKRELGEKG